VSFVSCVFIRSYPMSSPLWRRFMRHLSLAFQGGLKPRRSSSHRRAYAPVHARLEELESRLAPASFAVNARLQITQLSEPSEPEALAMESPQAPETSPSAVVFFESSVADNQILRQALNPNTDAVLLDSRGDGLKEMAAFLATRHDLTSIGVVAHGSPGAVALGNLTLTEQSLVSYNRELSVVGSALGPGAELDLWSCEVAAGQEGASLVRDLAMALHAGVAAADHMVGAATQGGCWQLDIRLAGARGKVPFSVAGQRAFQQLLGWSSAASMTTARDSHTATLLANGKVLVAGGIDANFNGLSSAELYDPTSDTWSSAGSMLTVRWGQTATLLNNGSMLVTGGRTTGPGNPTLSSAELYNPISNSWSSAGSMVTARWNHTATLLKDGRVLIVAGANPALGHPSSSAQLYDPVSNTWSSAGSLATARGFATATLLANGDVLVAGGTANGAVAGALSNAELYDPTSTSWSPAGSMVTGRWSATATLLPSGRVLVAGGTDANGNVLSSAELYDPTSNTWSSAATMGVPLGGPVTLLANGKVLAILADGTAELYDPASDSWSSAGSTPTAPLNGTATLLNNGEVLVAGGFNGTSAVSSAELYDPGAGVLDLSQSTISVTPTSIPSGGTATITLIAKDAAGNQFTTGGLPFTFGLGVGTGSGTFSNLSDNHNGTYTATFTGTSAGPIVITATLNVQPVTSTLPTITITPASQQPGWSAAASMTTARDDQTATLLANGQVLVVGGVDANSNPLSSAELYDPINNTWSSAGSLATARASQTATLLNNGRVLVTGGNSMGSAAIGTTLSSAELYDPISVSWSSAGSMSTPREEQTATLLKNGRVLVVAGFNPNVRHALSSADLYDPVSNTWSSAGSLATARGGATATLLSNGEVLVAGGSPTRATLGALSSAQLYDPTTNSWPSAASMITARWSATATLLPSGRVLVAGGLDANWNALSTAELYDPTTNTWTSAASMGAPLGGPVTLLANGKVLAILADGTAELYDPARNTWSSAGSIVPARTGFTATLLNSGEVLVAGGSDGNSAVSSAELYNPGVGVLDLSQSAVSATPASIPSGGTATVTLTAKDAAGNQLTTGGLPFSFGLGAGTGSGTFSNLTDNHNGTYAATFTGTSAGPIVITATLNGQPVTSTLPTITVTTASSATQFVVDVPGSNTIVAGNPFLVTVQAADSFGNPVTNYSGSSTVTIMPTPADPQSNIPIATTLNANGFGFLLANLKTAGAYTLTATAGTISGSSARFTVTPSAASYFTLTSPAAATTGSPIPVTVTAFDHYGNVATGYTGTVKFSSTDSAATLPANYTFTTGAGMDNGVHVFAATLMTAGNWTITATDTAATNPAITGVSSPVTTRGLVVAGTPSVTATGFNITFSKPFIPGNLALYGGPGTVPDVTLVGKASGPISGTLLVGPTNTSITFKATSSSLTTFFGAPVLPDDIYTVTLRSGAGAHGFVDSLGAGLDGAGDGGHADYVTTFAVTNAGKPILSIPDFARGPDGASVIKVPNDNAHGIPITLANATGVKDVAFTLSYNPSLLTVTGAVTADATAAGSAITLAGAPTIVDATHATANFAFHNDTAQSGTVVLGDILANVPSAAASMYKSKELLGLVSVTVNGAPFTGVTAGAIHINAYLGDVTGNGTIDGLDLATMAAVARGDATGFAAYRLLDPAIIGDPAADIAVDAGDVSTLAAFIAHLPTPAIPAIPPGLTIVPAGADPTLSFGEPQNALDNEKGRKGDGENGGLANGSLSPFLPISLSPLLSFTLPVLLDNPHPEGSTGMTEAVLALNYDPSVLTVSASDITLGTISSSGAGWRLEAVIDSAKGQIGITLYSLVPVSAAEAGSLVNITFHLTGPSDRVSTQLRSPETIVRLVATATPNGQEFTTQVDDDQGPLVLSAGRASVLLPAGPARRPLPRRAVVLPGGAGVLFECES
jgi:N-acetylneuraminic acid mutarotase